MANITVIITSYNNAGTIERAINSVLMQLYADFELHIWDDGSSDLTRYILEKYLNNPIVMLHYCIHRGLSETITEAIWAVRTEFLCFLSADDEWRSKYKLNQQYHYLNDHPEIGLHLTNGWKVTEKGESPVFSTYERPDYSYDKILYNSQFIYTSAMMRTKILQDNISPEVMRRMWVYDLVFMLLYSKVSQIGYTPVRTVAISLDGDETYSRTHDRITRLIHTIKRNKIRLYFIFRYGCKSITAVLLLYRFVRDIYSIIFKRWYK